MKRGLDASTGGGKRARNAPNPYLQSGSSGRRQREEVFSKRNRRQERALFFREDEEEQEEEAPPPASTGDTPAAVPLPPRKREEVPVMEWWDVAFLPKDMQPQASLRSTPANELYAQLKTTNQKSSVYVEHPVTIAPTKQSLDSDEPLKLFQTKAELKRIRRQNRALLNQEKRDKIAIGLIPPPPPRVRISNLLRVLSADHTADPTQIEARVREEMEQRKMQHVARNLALKLTPKEKAEKLRARVQRDALSSAQVTVAVFAVANHGLGDEAEVNEVAKKRLVKVLLTARKLMMSGRFLVVAAPSSVPGLIIVEGGPKSVRKFTRLVTQKIDWKSRTLLESAITKTGEAAEESSEEEVEQGEGDASGLCSLQWRGTFAKQEFEGFRMERVESVLDARSVMDSKNLAHLWDLVAASSSDSSGG